MAENEVLHVTGRLLDVGQVADMLNVSVATVRRWVLNAFIPYLKIGKAVRFSKADIDRWVRTKCSNSPELKRDNEVHDVNVA